MVLIFCLGGKKPEKIYHTPITNKEISKTLIENYSGLWKTVGDLIRNHFPGLAEMYSKVPEKHRLFDLYSLLVVNLTMATKYHKDLKDYRNGFCCVFPFEDYDGGELHFPELNVTVNLRPGDLIVFQSHLLTHGNWPVTRGNRKSCVLLTHNTVMNNSL